MAGGQGQDRKSLEELLFLAFLMLGWAQAKEEEKVGFGGWDGS